MNSFQRLRYFYNRCKPDQPLQADDDWYVDFDELGLRGQRCRSALQRRKIGVLLPADHPPMLVRPLS